MLVFITALTVIMIADKAKFSNALKGRKGL